MHVSALKHGQLFFDTYLGHEAAVTIVDIGAQNINGSLRQCAPLGCRYIGVDFVPGPGVDMVLDDPYHLPFADASVEVVVSSEAEAPALLERWATIRRAVAHVIASFEPPAGADVHLAWSPEFTREGREAAARAAGASAAAPAAPRPRRPRAAPRRRRASTSRRPRRRRSAPMPSISA